MAASADQEPWFEPRNLDPNLNTNVDWENLDDAFLHEEREGYIPEDEQPGLNTDSEDSDTELPEYRTLFNAQFRGNDDDYESLDSDYSEDEGDAHIEEEVRLPPDSPINVRDPNSPFPKESKGVKAKMERGERPLVCHLCQKKYCRPCDLKKHITNYHFTIPKTYSCPKCRKQFKQNSVFQHHFKKAQCERTWARGHREPKLPKKPLPSEMQADEELKEHSPAALFLHYYMPILRVELECTNLRGPNMFPEDRQRRLKARFWRPVTVNRALRHVLCILALSFMGYKTPRDPWRKEALFKNKFFTRIMSGNEFQMIRKAKCFCIPEVDTLPGNIGDPRSEKYDPMWRVQRIIKGVVIQSQRAATPASYVCIDEAMIPFEGRTSLKSFIPNKPNPVGLKMYVLADPKTGYIFNMIPCSGKEWPFQKRLGIIGSIVVALLMGLNIPGYATNLLKKGYCVVTDNFYTSFRLMEWLLARLTYYVGTVKSKRRQPEFMDNLVKLDGVNNMKRGDSKFAMSNTGIQLTTWLDNKKVLVASTFPYISNQLRVCTRHLVEKPSNIYKGIFQCWQPSIVKFYACFMGGVDRGNQKLSYYHWQPKSRRWTMAVYYALVDVCVFQAHLIYNKFHKKTKDPTNQWTIRDFKLMLITDLETQILDEFEEEARQEMLRTRFPEYPIRPIDLEEAHWKQVVNVLRRDHSSFHSYCELNKRRICVYCRDRNRKTDDSCHICKVAVHKGYCFFMFHTSDEYQLV